MEVAITGTKEVKRSASETGELESAETGRLESTETGRLESTETSWLKCKAAGLENTVAGLRGLWLPKASRCRLFVPISAGRQSSMP